MSVEYDDYLAEHIGNVNRGLHWMLDNLPLNQEQIRNLEKALIYSHDESKFDKEEYEPYDEYFYGDNQSYGVVNSFNYAWLHHIHRNPHHWQYWILMEDDPEGDAPWKRLVQSGTGEYKAALTNMPVMPLEIPLSYIYEMMADWWTFSWKNNNLMEIFSWYGSHREKQIIHPSSRAILEDILKKMWNVLALSAVRQGADRTDLEKQYISYWIEEPLFKGYSFEPSGKVPDDVTMYYDPTPDVSSMQHDDGEDGDNFGSKYTKRFEDELFKHSSAQVIGKVVDTQETENGLEVTVEHSEPEDDEELYSIPEIKQYISYWAEEPVEHSDTEDSDEVLYGVPELKKFPMPDKKHVKSAIRFFNYVDPKYEKELAEAILEKADEFGLVFDEDITVGEDNRFKKYLPEKKEES